MTERKPAGMSFTSWIDQQVTEAEQRGAFDDLPGAGQPLPASGDADAGQTWLRDYARREGVSGEEMLPVPLRLRREIERIRATVPGLPSERAVRAVAAELNERVLQWRRLPLGPPVFVPLVDEEDMVRKWRAGRPAVTAGQAARPGGQEPLPEPAPRRRWRRRRSGLAGKVGRAGWGEKRSPP